MQPVNWLKMEWIRVMSEEVRIYVFETIQTAMRWQYTYIHSMDLLFDPKCMRLFLNMLLD